jgi:hypothetical protein
MKMKKFEIVTSTSFGHKIIVEANTEKEAEEKVSYMGQNEMEEKAEDTWDVDSFPMICTVEEIL